MFLLLVGFCWLAGKTRKQNTTNKIYGTMDQSSTPLKPYDQMFLPAAHLFDDPSANLKPTSVAAKVPSTVQATIPLLCLGLTFREHHICIPSQTKQNLGPGSLPPATMPSMSMCISLGRFLSIEVQKTPANTLIQTSRSKLGPVHGHALIRKPKRLIRNPKMRSVFVPSAA